jgi:hypothetical protein
MCIAYFVSLPKLFDDVGQVYIALPALTDKSVTLSLEISEQSLTRAPRCKRRSECLKVFATLVRMTTASFGKYRGVALSGTLQSQARPLAKAVNGEVKVTCSGASCRVPAGTGRPRRTSGLLRTVSLSSYRWLGVDGNLRSTRGAWRGLQGDRR